MPTVPQARFRQIAIKPATTGLTSSLTDQRSSRLWPIMIVACSLRKHTLSIPASVLLANDTDPNGLPLSITGVSNPSNGTVTYNSSNQSIAFVPTTNYVGPASFSYTITDGQGTASANVSLNVNNSISAQSLFGTASTPSIVTENDLNAVELGVKFSSSVSGNITGIRFYKGPLNTGTHIGDLWSSNGTLLATATFTNETASGWQQVNFSNPVLITAGTTYIASYHTNGDYSVGPQLFCKLVEQWRPHCAEQCRGVCLQFRKRVSDK